LYLGEIDEQWIAHLKNIEHLRTGIGLVGYATRNPKNEYKLRGFNLFKEMWENIEHTVLGRVLQMRLTEEERQAGRGGRRLRDGGDAREPRRRRSCGCSTIASAMQVSSGCCARPAF
jgi:preprotein translocase subunit SecA